MAKVNEKALVNESSAQDFAMTFDEIGQILQLRRGTVWTIYQRALRKLRRNYPGILSELREAAMELNQNRSGRDEDLRSDRH